MKYSLIGQEVGRVFGRYVKPLVHGHPWQLSSPQRIQWPVCGGEGGRMAVTVQMQFESAVTEMSQDAFVGSAIKLGFYQFE